jgi:hypothetical protein
MILSSTDILRILGGSEIIRLSAKLKIVDAKPALSGAEGLFIYVSRFPKLEEFEATWTIWIESDGSEPDDLVLAEIKKLLPRVELRSGLMAEATTTEFRSENTQAAPETPRTQTAQVDLSGYEERFQALVEGVQDQMLLVTSGRPGADGKNGVDGRDGKDGRDLVATDAKLEDLQNVEEGIAKEKGQVLTWDGEKWTNLFVPQIFSVGGGSGSSSTGPGTGAGAEAEIWWKYHNTPSATPHAGDFHSDNQQTDLATQFYVSKTNDQGHDVSLLVKALLGVTARLYISDTSDPSIAHLFSVNSWTETASGYQIAVTHVETIGPETNFVEPHSHRFVFIPKISTSTDVQNLWTILGVAQGSTDLGTFPGNTIPNAATVKTALQSLEAKAEAAAPSSSLSSVAFTGSYSDLAGKPFIPSFTGDLLDVGPQAAADGQVLIWNQANGWWEPGTVGGGTTTTTGQATYRLQAGFAPPPSNGRFVINNANHSLATEVYISYTTNSGVDVSQVLRAWVDSSSEMYIVQDNAPAKSHLYDITAPSVNMGGYLKVPVVHVDRVGPAPEPVIDNNALCSFQFVSKTSATGLTIDEVRLDAENKSLSYSGGQLVSVSGTEVQVMITYNPDGSVHTVQKTSNGQSITKTLAYNPDGTLGTISVS